MGRDTAVESPISTTSSSEDSETETTIESNREAVNNPPCSLCFADDGPTQYIENCEELKSIIAHIETSSSSVRKVKYACQTCLYKFYTVIDQTRLKTVKAEREQRLAKVAALIESASTPQASEITSDSPAPADDTFPQDETADGDKDSTDSDDDDDECDTRNSLSEKEAQNVNDCHATASSPTELVGLEDHQQVSVEVASNPSTSSQTHLDVMFEQRECALITESGGALAQYKTPPLQCRYCPKIFVMKKPYQRHLRSHGNRIPSIRSVSSNRGRTPPCLMYACEDCSATFDSSAKLKSHCRIHLKRYYCTYCQKENLSLFTHEFHEAECKGEQMAKQEILEQRPVTRSLARSRRSGQSERAKSEVKSQKTLRSAVSGNKSQLDSKHNNDEETDDDDCTVSTYTDVTHLNTFVEDWVTGTCPSEYEVETLISQRIDPDTIVVSKTEYDIVMLERLIRFAERNVYHCFFEGCDYRDNSLSDMSLHEVLVHQYKARFSCRKCGGVFTTKLFHDYHLYLQNYGEYRCHKCTKRFQYEYHLRYHLVQHQKSDSYPCLFCGNSFMSGQELRIHCLETGHQPRRRKRLICIDNTMTIDNERTPEPPPAKRTYKCTINIMDLPKPPKRAEHEIWNKRKRMTLGDIDFEYQPGRNCVQTK